MITMGCYNISIEILNFNENDLKGPGEGIIIWTKSERGVKTSINKNTTQLEKKRHQVYFCLNGKMATILPRLWRSFLVVWLWVDVGKSVEGTLPFLFFALECDSFDGTRPVTVDLAMYISTKLKIDSLLCDEGKILGSRQLEPATNSSLVRVAFTLDEALCGWNSWPRFIWLPIV